MAGSVNKCWPRPGCSNPPPCHLHPMPVKQAATRRLMGKIVSVKPPQGTGAIYSRRITQSRRCTASREGDFLRLLTIAPDHDSTYGRK